LDTVRARIALAIDLGLLKPGERLPGNAEIARALGVGDITVRRALVSLCEDGVLTRHRGRNGGTLVADAGPAGRVTEVGAYRESVTEVRELIDHRLVLESGLTQLVAVRCPEDRLGSLRELVDQMDAAEGWADFHELDAAFHLAVASAGGPPSAVTQYRQVLRELYRYYLPYPMDQLRESNREHRRLLDALAARDPAAAASVTREHVEALHHTMFVGLDG
jgi:DNA-binding FadR family transcriptional regulator